MQLHKRCDISLHWTRVFDEENRKKLLEIRLILFRHIVYIRLLVINSLCLIMNIFLSQYPYGIPIK